MINFNLNEFLLAISFALDYAELDMKNKITTHTKRVAYISIKIAEELGMNNEEIFDIAALSILHDCGSGGSDYSLNKKDFENHCVKGEKIVSNFPFFTPTKNVVLYHHEYDDGSGIFGIKNNDIPLISKILSLTNLIEINYSHYAQTPFEINKIVNMLRDKKFSKNIVDAYLKVQSNINFWVDIEDLFITDTLKKIIPEIRVNYSYKDLHRITNVISEIIDSNTEFTKNHSTGLTDKVCRMAKYYGYSEDEMYKIMIASDLHDIGKLAISNDIINKPSKLTEEEFHIIKKHPYYTRKALEGVHGFEEITLWASNHHEKLNGMGYPFGINENNIDFNSRLLSCLDIYQALTEDRPYRKSLTHEKAMSVLYEMSLKGEIDSNIVDDINKNFI